MAIRLFFFIVEILIVREFFQRAAITYPYLSGKKVTRLELSKLGAPASLG